MHTLRLVLLDWPDDGVDSLLEVREGTGDWPCQLSAVNVGIDSDGAAVTVLDSLSDRGEDTNQLGIHPWSFHTERRVIHGEGDGGSSRMIFDGQPRDILKRFSLGRVPVGQRYS